MTPRGVSEVERAQGNGRWERALVGGPADKGTEASRRPVLRALAARLLPGGLARHLRGADPVDAVRLSGMSAVALSVVALIIAR
jgi:hypothetical protein